MHNIEVAAALLFGIALVHTFAARQLTRLAHRFPGHGGLFHLLGEVEVVFGFWAIVLIVIMALMGGGKPALDYAESRDYTEPLFVFVVMVVAASRPVLRTVAALMDAAARLGPLPHPLSFAWVRARLGAALG